MKAQLPLGTIWEVPYGGELIRLSVSEYKGNRHADLRRFYRSGDEWKHGRQGCPVPLWTLAELHAALGAWLEQTATSDAPGDS